jgi:chemotaxis protein MotB
MRNVKARRPRLPLFFTLGLSLLLHAALFRVQLPANLLKLLVPEPPTPQLALIELTPEVASTTNPTDQTEVRLLQDFRFSALERTAALEQTLANALSQQAETEATRQQQLAALETAQIALSGQVETLTVEKAELSAQLANERQRRAELEQQLQEARRAKEAELSGVRGTYDRLVAALKGEISQKEIALHQAKERLVVTILDRVLFPSGQATLTPAGQRVLEKVGVILAKVNDRRILIEGHTDNVPIGPALSMRFPTNWELSTARATEVVKYLIIQVKLPAERLSAVGRADTAPVASNVNEEGRQQNRRIEIILLPPEEQPGSIS